MSIKLSICIPTYNRANFLKQQLETLDQALSNSKYSSQVEIVFRDNASPDNTQEVIKKFAQKYPVKNAINEENIGLTRNLLRVPEEASGEFVWLLGDDDFVKPEAIDSIFSHFSTYPNAEGIVVAHGIEYEKNRANTFDKLKNKEVINYPYSFAKKNTKVSFLNKFEEVFQYTDFQAALNFLSNVVFPKKLWDEKVQQYLEHCNNHKEWSDTITSTAYLCIWADILTGKPVAFINNPLVVAFVGNQEVLTRWDTLKTSFFLDAGRWFINAGADPKLIQLYQRKIYSDKDSIGRLIVSKEKYVKKYFSLASLIKHYGKDHVLWNTFHKAYYINPSRSYKLTYLFNFSRTLLFIPKYWKDGLKIIYNALKNKNKKKTESEHFNYQAHIDKMNTGAQEYFRKHVNGAVNATVHHPVFLKHPQFITVGTNFFSHADLRIEAWDEYKGVHYTPSITIGNNVVINFRCHIGAINKIEIHDNVLIGSNVLITDHQHGNLNSGSMNTSYIEAPLYSKGSVIIEENVWIGENACIMPGARIGKNSVIGANSVVTKDVPQNSVIAGIPGKIIRSLD